MSFWPVVRAGLRRPSRGHSSEEATRTFGDVTVDLARRVVTRGGAEVHLTRLEYDVLRYLLVNVDRVVTHRQLLSQIWGPENAEETQYLRVQVGRLRQKLEDDTARPRFLLTEPGVGYRFGLRPKQTGRLTLSDILYKHVITRRPLLRGCYIRYAIIGEYPRSPRGGP